MTDIGPTKTALPLSGRKRAGSTAGNMTPMTPRPGARFSDVPAKDIQSEESSTNTPTRHDFGGMSGQRALPDEPFTPSRSSDNNEEKAMALDRENSRRSVRSTQSGESHDVEMADDDEGQDTLDGQDGQDEQDGSDNDSVSSDVQKPSKKKKKGQRFYCTDFPPCNLSFTRSEHLARHIRKHTGERPFQCHCSRRFSRLDNLRQHAQTVHVNEEIPGDSLAATGTRFQRQIRTDRVRPPNNRPRSSTMSSQGGSGTHSRGHSRNLSASSIGSTVSSLGGPEDARPRPAPLAIAQDSAARARLSLESFNPAIGNTGNTTTQFAYYPPQSPSGYSTPTSTTLSTGTSSPRFTAGMQSPPANLSRNSFYNGSRTHSRRLSVPSGPSTYQTPSSVATAYPQPYFTAMSPPSASGFSNTGNMVASPTSSTFSHGRRESDAELEWRRRTWHPGTQLNYAARPATSGLSYHQTPDDASPAPSLQPAASQITRLPGIESFDHAPPPPGPSAHRVTSPMQVDSARRPQSFSSTEPQGHAALEAGLHQNLTRLDIAGNTGGGEGQGWIDQARTTSHGRPTTAPHVGYGQHSMLPGNNLQQNTKNVHPMPVSAPVVERNSKRHAWYGGPGPVSAPLGSQPIMIAHRTSPESTSSDGVPTPSTSQGREVHPAIMLANGTIEGHHARVAAAAAMTEEQQHAAMQAHFQSGGQKPEPTRADSGFYHYAQMPGAGAPGHQHPSYVMQTGHGMQIAPAAYGAVVGSPTHVRQDNDMGRLEALVAVATSEGRAVEHRS